MNFTNECRAFFEWHTYNKIPDGAISLWYTLLQVNNRCSIEVDGKWYWRVEFKAYNTMLASLLSISVTQLGRMRNHLIQSGLILYRSGKGNQAGVYTMIPFDKQYVKQNVMQTVSQTVVQVWSKVCTEIINNNTGNSNNSYHHHPHPREREEAGPEQTADALIQKHFMRPAYPVEVEYLAQQLNKREASLIEEALKIACSAGQPNLNYLKGIFKNFTANGIRTEDEYWGHEADRDITSWEKGGRS